MRAFQWPHLKDETMKEIVSRRLLGVVAADNNNHWETLNMTIEDEQGFAFVDTIRLVSNAKARKNLKAAGGAATTAASRILKVALRRSRSVFSSYRSDSTTSDCSLRK